MKKYILLILYSLLLFTYVNAQQSKSKSRLFQDIQQKSQKVAELWQEKEYEKAVIILEEIYSNTSIDEYENIYLNTLYNLTCGYSLLGKKEKAIYYFKKVVDAGFANYNQIEEDADLDNIRHDKRFQKIIKAIKFQSNFWDNPTINSPYCENLSDQEKLAGLSKLWSEIKYNFANFENVPNLNLDSLYFCFIPKVKQTKNTLGYYRTLQQFCSFLHDGHTQVNVPNELYQKLYYRPPIRTKMVENKVLVTEVLEDSLRKSGIHPGLEIISIENIPVKQYAEQNVIPYQSSSTRQNMLTNVYEYYLLCGAKTSVVVVEFRDGNNNLFRNELRRTYGRIQSYSNIFEFKILEQKIAYVALNSFGYSNLVIKFDSVFTSIMESKALIIDIRSNTGGNSDIAYNILGYLTDRPFRILKSKTRKYYPYYRTKGIGVKWYDLPDIEWSADGEKYYNKPVVILTGANTGSSAEDFCVAFSFMKRGIIIGERTAGTTGQPLVFGLPGGGSGLVCTLKSFYPDGKEFVGIGIFPERKVHPTIRDIRQGKDVVLEAALDYLKDLHYK